MHYNIVNESVTIIRQLRNALCAFLIINYTTAWLNSQICLIRRCVLLLYNGMAQTVVSAVKGNDNALIIILFL